MKHINCNTKMFDACNQILKRKYLPLYFFIFIFLTTAMQLKAQGTKVLIPEPVKIQSHQGVFKLSPDVKIIVPSSSKEVQETGKILSDQLYTPIGYKLAVTSIAETRKKAIYLKLNKIVDTIIGDEGYHLEVNSFKIEISANKPAGIFYGIQSLMQMLPADIEAKVKSNRSVWEIPSVSITDYPRFKWRGLLLDVARHFFPKDFIKKYIDHMVKYKYNVFQLHLTEDTGWRIEIKKYPKLTEVGAWRVPRTGKWGNYEGPQPDEAATDGGFYTQEDIREIVKYAQDRFVTIVPEIDIPGHAQALIAAYPTISCTGKQYHVFPGDVMGSGPGVNVVCIGNEDNYKILDGIFSEIADLFPGQYIHVGGDEVNKEFWKDCPKCQKLMSDEGLKSLDELQSYLMHRVEKILAAKGKKFIGWDEILQGGLAPDATVMSWRGTEGGIAAAKAGHNVVMTPTQYCYLDFMQGDPAIERIQWGQYLPLSKVYNFEPVPPGVDAKYILGGQGNVWTEFISNTRRVEYMTWPRGLAMAEVLWSPVEKRNWKLFVPRMEAQLTRFDQAEINYAPSIYDPIIITEKNQDGNLKIKLSSEMNDLDIYYTFDHSFPDKFSQQYNNIPIAIPKGASEIWVITYRNGKPKGRLLVKSITQLHAI